MIEGEVEVGDEFDWQPYGTEGWPHAYERVKVERLTYPEPTGGLDEMQSTADLCADDDQDDCFVWTRNRNGELVYNELPHFREMCERVK